MSRPNFLPAEATRLLCDDLPAIGGAVGGPEDFIVEEIPAYTPQGSGEHLYVWIEKRDLTTPQAIERLARHFGVSPRDVGSAGLKDRHGVTRQWLSFVGANGAQASRYRDPEERLSVLHHARHGNKLRTGHLRGNRFTVVLRGVVGDARPRALAILARVDEEGLPNYFGAQRFGRHGDNARRAWTVLHGEGKLPRDRGQRRLLISALQSQLFNELLHQRLCEGETSTLLGGEVLSKRESGGVFVSEDRDADQRRLDDEELTITGPMPGPKMVRPGEGSPAREQEDALLARLGGEAEAFAVFGKLARGARRPLLVYPEGLTIEQPSDDAEALRLRFSLPSGSYATVLLRELTQER